MDFDNQIRAIRYAIKELQHERLKAIDAKDKDWLNSTYEYIQDLTQALEVINTMKVLKTVITA